jgi:hypothetical protein
VDPIPAVERQVGFDLARHGLLVAPVILGIATATAGLDGLAGAGIALALVVANFVMGALSLGWAAQRTPGVLTAVALGGFLVRMGVVLGVMLAVRDHVNFPSLAITLLVSHLGLLAWESKVVGLSLAAPGLRPKPAGGQA